MAYNFLCETDREPQWDKINTILKRLDKLEAFPIAMPQKDIPALVISVPLKNVGKEAYGQFIRAYNKLTRRCGFVFCDMYYGKMVDKTHLKTIEKEIS